MANYVQPDSGSIDSVTPQEWNRATQRFVDCESKSDLAFTITDPVDHPPHYNFGNIECIDYLEDNLTQEGFKFYLDGNIKKYLHRWRYKGKQLEDLRKAQWYLERLIESVAASESDGASD